MPELSAPDSINDARTQALLAMIARLAALDLTQLLVYRIDSVPASALPHLGWQFDLLSPLWQLLAPANSDLSTTEEATAARRMLIKNAIPLHRLKGTPAAIKQALASLGWSGAVIQEGQAVWGGTQYPSDQGWAVCRILVNLPTIDLSTVEAWSPDSIYAAGSFVSFNGSFFWASDIAPAGTQPQFGSLPDVPDVTKLSNFPELVQLPWYILDDSVPLRPGSASDVATISAVFEFFKPARAKLDSVWFVLPTLNDSVPPPRDLLIIDGIAEYMADSAPAPADVLGAISVTLAPIVDDYGPIAPVYDGHYRHSGITHGANEPTVADSALILNGQAVLEGG